MSNQRQAQMYRAAMPDDGKASIKSFISLVSECQDALEKEGNEDAAYYFQQLKEYMVENPSKIFNTSASKILGL